MRINTDGGIVTEVLPVTYKGVDGYAVHGNVGEGFYPADCVEVLKDSTTVFVFDHRSGFDWNINRQVVEKERDEYCKAGWLTASDAIYEIEVPVYPFVEGQSNDAVTEYLSGEDYLALGGKVLWSIAKE
jgi:hypothetical protein